MSQQITDPIIRQLMETASFGEAAKIFLNSDMGKYIVDKATEEIDEAVAGLIDADPFDTKKITELQLKIRSAQGAITWLGESITEGNHAILQLEEPA